MVSRRLDRLRWSLETASISIYFMDLGSHNMHGVGVTGKICAIEESKGG